MITGLSSSPVVTPKRCDEAPGAEQLDQHRDGVDRQIDGREGLSAGRPAREFLADHVRELEIDHGRYPGHQQQEQRDHQEIARFEQQHKPVKRTAAQSFIQAGLLRLRVV